MQSRDMVARIDGLQEKRFLITPYKIAQFVGRCFFARAKFFRQQPAIASKQSSDNYTVDLVILKADLGQMSECHGILVCCSRYIDRVRGGGASRHERTQALLCFCTQHGNGQRGANCGITGCNDAASSITDDSYTSSASWRWRLHGQRLCHREEFV